MSIKKLVYCEVDGCGKSAIIGNGDTDYDMPSTWLTVKTGSARWGRHFCSHAHLILWASQQILNTPLGNIPKDANARFVRRPEHNETIKKEDRKQERNLPPGTYEVNVGAGGRSNYCVMVGCQQQVKYAIEAQQVTRRLCGDHTLSFERELRTMGIPYDTMKI